MSSGPSSIPTTRPPPSSMAVSVPSQTGSLKIPSRSVYQEHECEEEDTMLATSLMGSSLPISIPVRPDSPQRNVGDATRKSSDTSFVPPHLMERDGDDGDMGDIFSPRSMRREQLLRRNEILRSTGFIEIQKFTAPTGELIDAVKESAMAQDDAHRRHEERRVHVRASSLTAALGTSC